VKQPFLATLAALLFLALSLLVTGSAQAGNAANKARAALNDCLQTLPLDKLSDEKAIEDCLARAQSAADQHDKREGQIEFQRRLDDMDRMIERTRRATPYGR
jgi:hypothetical protein